MIKYIVLVLAAFSINVAYSANTYRKINSFVDDYDHPFLVVRSDLEKSLYSIEPIVYKGKEIRTTILKEQDFNNLKTELGE